MNKFFSWIKSFFVKRVDDSKLFSDISQYIEDEPKIDYRKLNREGKDLFKYEVEGEEFDFGNSSEKFVEVEAIKMSYPQPLTTINRECVYISGK